MVKVSQKEGLSSLEKVEQICCHRRKVRNQEYHLHLLGTLQLIKKLVSFQRVKSIVEYLEDSHLEGDRLRPAKYAKLERGTNKKLPWNYKLVVKV